jgi:2-keto-3-deoxy-L-rhamnonate aldolase RhmA
VLFDLSRDEVILIEDVRGAAGVDEILGRAPGVGAILIGEAISAWSWGSLISTT